MQGRCLLNALKEDKATATGVREWTKSLWAAIGLDGMDSGKGKGAEGSSGVCKDQRCVSTCVSSVHIDVHILLHVFIGASIQ